MADFGVPPVQRGHRWSYNTAAESKRNQLFEGQKVLLWGKSVLESVIEQRTESLFTARRMVLDGQAQTLAQKLTEDIEKVTSKIEQLRQLTEELFGWADDQEKVEPLRELYDQLLADINAMGQDMPGLIGIIRKALQEKESSESSGQSDALKRILESNRQLLEESHKSIDPVRAYHLL